MGKKLKTTAQLAVAVDAVAPAPATASSKPAPKPKQKESKAAAAPTEKAPTATTPSKPSAERNEFLKLFWNLAESDVAVRTQAVAQVLAHLTQQQTKRDASFDDDLQYTLKRLVRGLASSRDAARQGFSTALAGLLETFSSSIALTDVRTLLREAMEVHSSMKGMEQREHMFGRLFGLLALHRSGRLAADQRTCVEVVTELLEMAKWKKWLREACYEAVLAVLADVETDVFVADVVPVLALHLDGDVSAYNAEQVLLAAGVHHYMHASGIEDKVPSTFPAQHFVRRKAMHALVEPLKSSSACYPRVHAAWFSLFGHVLHTGANATQLDSDLFHEAWSVLVENTLLDRTSATHERRGLAFKLFELVLPHLPRPVLRATLTPHFVKCLYTNAVSKKNYLHDAARHTLQVFFAHAPEEYVHFFQKQFVSPMATLVALESDSNDDEEEDAADANETKAVRLSNGGFDALLALEEEKERAEAIQKKHDNVRLWALDALVTSLQDLFALDNVDAAAEALTAQSLRFLVFHTFFTASGKAASAPAASKKKAKKAAASSSGIGLDAALTVAAPVLSSTVLANALKRVLSLLSVKLSGASTSALSRIFAVSQELLAATDAARLRHAFAAADSDDAQVLKTVTTRVAELRSAWTTASAGDDAAKTQQLEAFLLLFMSSGVQLLDPSQRSDAVVVVTDLDKCYSDLVVAVDRKPTKKNKKSAVDADAPNSMVVFTDMLLSLLSQDSSAMREIVAHVFRSMLPLLNAESIQTMLHVLVPAADDGDADDDEDDDRVTRRTNDEEDDEEDSDMDEPQNDDDETDEVVLSSASDVTAALSSDPKFAELHREDMALAAIVGHVKDRANRKKNAKKAAMHVLHFKLRVLDLLQVFVTKCATSSLVLALPLPLFQALVAIQKTDKDARVLSERLQSVLNNKILRAKDVPSSATLSPAERTTAAEHLTAVVDLLTTKSLEKEQAGKVGAGLVVYFVRVLCSSNMSETSVVQPAVRTAVTDAFTKKHSRFPQIVFDDLVTRFPLIAVHVLLEPLTAIATASTASESKKTESSTAAPAAVDEFSKCEVFRLLSLLLKPKLLAEANEQQVFRSVQTALQTALVALMRSQQQTDGHELKAKRMKLVLSCVLQFVKSWKQLSASSARETKQLSELLTAVTALASNSPVVKSMVKQIAEASGLPAAIAAAAAAAEKVVKAKEATKDAAKTKDTKAAKAEAASAADKKTQKAKKALAAAKLSKQTKKNKATKRKRADSDAE